MHHVPMHGSDVILYVRSIPFSIPRINFTFLALLDNTKV